MTGFSVVTTSTYTSVPSLFKVINAFAGAAVGDIIQSVEILDQATNPAVVVDTVWNNLTQQTFLGAVTPAAANITPVNAVTQATYQTTTQNYTVTTATAGTSVGNFLSLVETFSTTTIPPTLVASVWTNLNTGAVVAAPGFANVTPGTSASVTADVVTTAIYTANTANAGQYAIGDVLQQVVTINPVTLAVVASEYNNLTSGVRNVTIAAQSDLTPGQTQTVDTSTTALYTANAASAGNYAVGDVIQQVVILNPSTVPPTVVSTEYNNLTSGTRNVTVTLAQLTPGQPTTVDTSTTALYTAVVTRAGQYTAGDSIQQVQILNPTTVPPTVVSTTYNNLTTGTNNVTLTAIADLSAGSISVSTLNTQALYKAVVLSAGNYSVGDILQQNFIVDSGTVPPTVVSTSYSNLTTGAHNITLAAQTDIVPVAVQPAFTNVVERYTVTTNFASGNVGDVLENVQTFNPETTPPTLLDSIWNNLTQQTTNFAAPATGDITPIASVNATTDFDVSTIYTAIATVAGSYTIGDVLQSISVYSPATVPPTLVDTLWLNLTTGLAIAGAVPAANVTVGVSQSVTADTTYSAEFQVTSAGSAGTSVGDILQRAVSINPTTSAVVSTVWNNLTAGTTIAAPSYANLTPVSPALTPSYENVTSLYYVITAGVGYAVNDVVQEVKTFSTASGLPVLTQTVWNNLTQGAVIGGGVTLANVKPVGTPTTFPNNYTTVAELYYAGVSIAPYNINDQLVRVIVFNTAAAAPAAPVSETWYNLTQLTTLAAIPPAGDVIPGTSPAGTNNYSTIVEQFVAVTTSAGFWTAGDILDAVVVLDQNTGTVAPITVISQSWFNLTTQTEIPAANVPGVGDVKPFATQATYTTSTSLFVAKAVSAGNYAIGDTISKTVVLDPTQVPPAAVSTTWTNVSTQTVLGATPPTSDLTASQSQLPPAIGPQASGESLSVYVANQSSLNYFPVVNQYLVSTAFAVPAPGGAVGDTVQDLQVYDATTNPATLVSQLWTNLTTGATYPSAPPIADLTSTFGNGLTNAELRAAPVPVSLPTVNRVSAMITVPASTAGTTAIGIVAASFYNNSTTVAATVAGGTLPPSTAITFQANDADKLAAIAYSTAAGGSLLIATLT